LQQGVNLNELNRYAQARSALETALKISPNYAFALVNLCATLNKLGNYQEALNACEKALQGDGKWDESGPADAFLPRVKHWQHWADLKRPSCLSIAPLV
jgi:tetratricopeptide (TPR) repeat protein